MHIDDLSKSNHSLASLFRFSKDQEEHGKGWVTVSSSRSWTPDDKDLDDELNTKSTHSRSFFTKISRTKSMEEALRPMASISHALTKLPRSSFASMRTASMRSFRIAPSRTPSPDDVTLPPREDEDDDDSLDDSFHQEEEEKECDEDQDSFKDDATLSIVLPPTRQEGTVIRRRREKQLSKGRRSMRQARTRSASSGSDGSWDKFMAKAAAPSPNLMPQD
ncbi:hypothetical protein MPSEU_000976200 [Mayamaea pseudoterrestris]|nr:hypothetical protein MPSEU_000976200 [Mayamaea pseudoterrestris]